MRRLAWLFLIIVIVADGRASTYAARPDFSGSWSASGRLLSIRQDATSLAVTSDSATRVYNLDGAESHFRLGRAQVTARARWVGSALVVELTSILEAGTWQDMEVYSLDYQRQLIVVRIETTTDQPMMSTTTSVYMRPRVRR